MNINPCHELLKNDAVAITRYVVKGEEHGSDEVVLVGKIIIPPSLLVLNHQ